MISKFLSKYFEKLSGKNILSRRLLFEKKLKKEIDTTGNIKSFEDACQFLNIKFDNKKHFNSDICSINAYAKLIIINRAINNGWEPDFSNNKQQKWYIWWRYDNASSGFVFIHSCDTYDGTYSRVGARFYYETREQCEHVARHFTKEFNEFLLGS